MKYRIMHYHTSDKRPGIIETHTSKAAARVRLAAIASHSGLTELGGKGSGYWHKCYFTPIGEIIGGHAYYIEAER